MRLEPAGRLAGVEKSAIRRIFDRAAPSSINLGLGEPDFPTPVHIRQAAIAFLDEGKVHYTPNAGYIPLRRAIAGYYGDEKLYERVCVTSGSQEALFVALMALVNPGDEVLVPDPGFLAYPTVVGLAGGKPVGYRFPADKGFTFDPEDFRNKITEHTRAVIVSSPSNPTGRTLRMEDLQTMTALLRNTQAVVISDEIYRELHFSEYPPSMSDVYPETLVVSGLSKSCAMTGWRLGWVWGEPEVVHRLTVLHQYVTTCASTVSQHAALAAFTDAGRTAREALRADLRARRDFILGLIDAELGCGRIVPDGGFYVMMDVARFGPSFEVAERLLEQGVITIPGAAFGREGEGYLRLSFATDFDVIEEGIRRIRAGLFSKDSSL